MVFEKIENFAKEAGKCAIYFSKGAVNAYNRAELDNLCVEIMKSEDCVDEVQIKDLTRTSRYETAASIPTSILLGTTAVGICLSVSDMMLRGVTPENALLMGTSVVYNPASHWGVRNAYDICKKKIKKAIGLEETLEDPIKA